MKTITFYDTETTNLPNWKEPSGGENQPHIVQLSAIQCDAESREILQRIDLIVAQEDKWGMSPEALETHGITVAKSQEIGLPEIQVVSTFLGMCMGGTRVAHNRTFDQRIIRIALKRYGFSDGQIEEWSDKDTHECTMLKAKPIMKLPPKGKWGWKNPKLEEAYKFFCGQSLGDQAHSSIYDTQACMAVYWGIQDYEPPVEKCLHKNWDTVNQNKCPECGEDIPF